MTRLSITLQLIWNCPCNYCYLWTGNMCMVFLDHHVDWIDEQLLTFILYWNFLQTLKMLLAWSDFQLFKNSFIQYYIKLKFLIASNYLCTMVDISEHNIHRCAMEDVHYSTCPFVGDSILGNIFELKGPFQVICQQMKIVFLHPSVMVAKSFCYLIECSGIVHLK